MGQLQQSVDPTGALSEVGLAQQDIDNIINEFNRLNDNLTGGNIQLNKQDMIVYDNTTNRVLLGFQQILQVWGLFVSKVGVDVRTATADQLIFNSNQNVFKIVLMGNYSNSYSFSGGTVSATITISHGLGFIPIPLVFYDFSGSYELLPFINAPFGGSAGSATGTIQNLIKASTNANNLVINIYNGNTIGSQTYNFKYYLLQETAN